MKKTLILAFCAVATISWGGDLPTMAELESQFAERIISLANATNVPPHMMEEKIMMTAASVFSNHTEVIAAETAKNFAELPPIEPSELPSGAGATQQDFDLSVLSVPQLEGFLIVFGWQPKRVAQTAKAAALSRRFGPSDFGRRALLEAALPDKYYRLNRKDKPTIVIKSLGEFFLVECKRHDWGVLMPESMQWLKPKESRTTESTPTK